MKKILSIVPRWFPSIFVMAVIFIFSSQRGDELPNFMGLDYFIKKASHAIGYGLLALSYLHVLNYEKKKYWAAWLMAIIYSATDEFHQSFVAGRNASVYDVILFDNLGALLILYLHFIFRRKNEKEIDQT